MTSPMDPSARAPAGMSSSVDARPRRLPRRIAGRVAALAAVLSATSLTAVPVRGADPPNPLPPILESLSIGPATEFRLAIVHPVFAPPAVEGADAVPALAVAAPLDALGVGDAPNAARTRLPVTNLDAATGYLALPGDLVRTDVGDLVVREHRLLRAGARTEVPVLRTSHPPAADAPREEPRFLRPLPGPALLWVLLHGAGEKEMIATADDLCGAARVETARRSPADLPLGPRIAARVREYRAALRTMSPPRGGIRRETVGYAVVLDGALAGIEVCADGAGFASEWESRVEGIAVEAALLEAEAGLLEQELPDPQNPDRCLKDVKGALLALYAVEMRRERLEGLGNVLDWTKGETIGRAVLTTGGRLAHLLLVIDPAHRRTPEPEDPLSPGVLERKARLTEAEKRWLDRRKQQ